MMQWLAHLDVRPGMTTSWAVVCVCFWLELQAGIKGPYEYSPHYEYYLQLPGSKKTWPAKGPAGTIFVVVVWALVSCALWSIFTPHQPPTYRVP